ncbi:MAG: ribokinase [Eubacteriales bacterium]|nr:ribokinase [Eubacteriales bacterium]
MKVLNYGSLNLDYVYTVDHIVQGGETILSEKVETFCGGKGMNQSIALAKAGLPVYHAGIVGEEGDFLLDTCREYGVDTTYIRKLPAKGGHTMIQVDKNGQNCIILYGGTNRMQTKESIDETLADFGEGDYLVLQNEINLLGYIIDRAYEKKMKIVLNPSPFDAGLDACDMTKVSLFLLNEIEGEQFTGTADPDEILAKLHELFPKAEFVLTLGSRGAVYSDGSQKVFQDIFKVKTVDTTAAGDTFTGFFLASTAAGKSPAEALRIAAKASSIAVGRQGAAPSIPTLEEVMASLQA